MRAEFKEYKEDLPKNAVLPKLKYTYKDVDYIMKEHMLVLHYTKLHQGYIDRYNKKLNDLNISSLSEASPEDQVFLLFNLGGYINHAFFWESFSHRKEDYVCSKELKSLITTQFGSVEKLCEVIESKIAKIMGSGWIWLVYQHGQESPLLVSTTMNQDFPLEGVPLLNLDLWEHAYYLQYEVDKVMYIRSLCRSLNWSFASERLALALSLPPQK
ncbi:superoxide dismutase, Fe-Mn family [Nematocida sp. AWRm77]|nr:superoxide dismutase, Fe-Mn family [Nematocida sp. AWRm77]